MECESILASPTKRFSPSHSVSTAICTFDFFTNQAFIAFIARALESRVQVEKQTDKTGQQAFWADGRSGERARVSQVALETLRLKSTSQTTTMREAASCVAAHNQAVS